MKSAATLDFMYTNVMEALDARTSSGTSSTDSTSSTTSSLDSSDTKDSNYMEALENNNTYSDRKLEVGENETDQKAMANTEDSNKNSEGGESKTNLEAMAGLVPQPFSSKAICLNDHSSPHRS